MNFDNEIFDNLDHSSMEYDVKKCVPSLLSKIKKYNESYRNGAAEIPDDAYDCLVEQLKAIDPENDWFKSIEPVYVPTGRKEKLPIEMKSLDKVKTVADIKKWLAKFGFNDNTNLVIMPKFDGCSLLCDESNQLAWTRGGEDNEGMLCHSHVKKINTSFHSDCYRYTFGEAIISQENWKNHFEGKINPRSGNPYKSARNTVAGLLRNDIAPEELEHVDFVRYGFSGDCFEFGLFTSYLRHMSQKYEQNNMYLSVKAESLNEEGLRKIYFDWCETYEIDGLVIYIDEIFFWDKVGRHSSTGNPQWAIAYKGDFEKVVETKVKSVNVCVSKSGFLKPTVSIESVNLSGASVSEPTGYNMRWIQDMEIAAGAVVAVKRSGEVIPKIIKVTKPAPQDSFNSLWDEMAVCPVCGHPTTWNRSGVELMCTNQNCFGIKYAKIVHFFTTVGCFGIGPETFYSIVESGFDTVEKIISMKKSELTINCLIGPSMTLTVADNNAKIKNGVPAEVLMHASDCFEGIGKTKAADILNAMSDEELYKFNNLYTNLHIDGDSITIKKFNEGYAAFVKYMMENPSLVMIGFEKSVKAAPIEGRLSGLHVCFSKIRDKDLEEKIKALGGEIVNSVSKTTTDLIVNDTSSSSSKITKARSIGVVVSDIETFKKYYKLQ